MTGFLERWANPQPSKPPAPALPEVADSESIEAGSGGIPPVDPPELTAPTAEQRVSDVDTAPQPDAGHPAAAAPSLKGSAVELWPDGRRFFLVADEEDAQEAIRRFGAHLGEVWTSGELELVASIPDQATRDEVEAFKREMDGCLSLEANSEGVSPSGRRPRLSTVFPGAGRDGAAGPHHGGNREARRAGEKMTGKQRQAEEYARGNRLAAEIIAADPNRYPGVMQEWARLVLNPPATRRAA